MTDNAPRLAIPVGAADHVLGPAAAPVTLVEYGDFECPFCGRAYPVVKALRRELGDRLRFVFRHFPITRTHPHAQWAAEAAEAAAAQGRFWEMHDQLLVHQNLLGDEHLGLYIGHLDLDADRLRRELAAHVHSPRVLEDVRSGERSGVRGTPTFFINGARYDGSYALEVLLAAVQRAEAAALAER
jgi:protein-disulfide isomerase